MEYLFPDDFNVKVDTDIREKTFAFKWTVQDIQNIPVSTRSMRFSLSGEATQDDWYATVTNLTDGKFRVSLTCDAEEPIPLRIEHSSKAFGSKPTSFFEGTSSSLYFQERGDERVLLDIDCDACVDLVFECSMKIYGFDLNTTCKVSTFYDDLDLEEYQDGLGKLMHDKSIADVRILVNGRCFPLHKCVLKFRAPTFFQLHRESIEEGELVLSNMESHTFETLMLYVYTGKAGLMISRDWCRKLYNAAHIYALSGLKRRCAKFLSVWIDVDSVVDYFLLADENKDELLKMQCRVFMRGHLAELATKPKWNSLIQSNPDVLDEVMKVHE